MTERVIAFSDYSAEEYALFLRAKSVPEFRVILDDDGLSAGLAFPDRFSHLLGLERETAPVALPSLSPFLFPDQSGIVRLAMDAERFAVWSDCGLGKTLIELEFARLVVAMTGGRVLIITLAGIVEQIVAEAERFYGEALPVRMLETREEMRAWCGDDSISGVAITNYEKMNPEDVHSQVVPEMKALAGIVLDESSRLKTGGGKQKWGLIKSAKGVRYKLSCTATPAPNEVMEFASQAAFLERIRDEADVIWTWFTRDQQTQEWTVKPPARPHFFRWMASWSIYVRNPAVFGWDREIPAVPEPVFIEHEIWATAEQRKLAAEVEAAEKKGQKGPKGQKGRKASAPLRADMFEVKSLGMVGRGILSQIAKGFRYEDVAEDEERAVRLESLKPGFVADLAASEVAHGHQVLVWCTYDEEAAILEEMLRRRGVCAIALGGKDSKKKRAAVLDAFREGWLQVLITKPSFLGFGLNFQFCTSMIFSGFTDSFEAFYQAVRRAYRFGQRHRLRVHLPYIPCLEEPILRNVLRKSRQFEELIAEQERAYVDAMRELEGRDEKDANDERMAA